ncbi:putative protein [Arabidopsis thaliana]|uniref:At4g27530 n=4 Tax=Arabidopsis TaxID=3701 RepID=Q9T077_ARATH|nr:uncharacterized protein AT4G27530 [Arabidopsis thaliana]KAG7622006.1 hypothetical protein ISN44_As04g028450 [Arabidopsis suecica]AAS49085.1 At4g27530 [Arabidopsis thaliana]AEE85354.1 hypothetical protein AT4G27530 [Arabidopsis thaliana]OAP00992.1 hypothetical protein AXX17_AT4G31660 [Arabidopsis thaliana]CAB38265.1 putative protein [Arabidopsis thaliana]|eukprot:NP_194483.1 hypothetical protein AT4G27530 [Arabidopsis thaliana]
MAAMFLAKRGAINIHRASSLHIDYNNSSRSVVDGVITITNSRYFASHGNNGEKSEEEAMGTTTDGKAPNVTLGHAADTAKEGLKRATDAAIKKSGDVGKPKSVENDEGDDQEDVAVGDDGTVKGQNQSAG